MKQQQLTSSALLAALVVFVFIFVFFVYAFLHEAGHALAGWLFGQTLTEFDIWGLDAHVGMAGNLTVPQQAVQSAAGISLPLFVWAVFMGLVARKGPFLLETLKLLSSATVINTLLPWIVLPILYLAGRAPSDDVTNFLSYSQMPPVLLSVIALLLYISCWNLFLAKIDGWRSELQLFRLTDRNLLVAGARSLLPAMMGLLAACLLAAVLLNDLAPGSSVKFQPPANFVPLENVDLSERAYSAAPLAEFTLEKPTAVGVFVTVHDINTTYFDLRVTGPNGFDSVVLHGEGYRASQDGGLWQENLKPGTYQILLTSDRSHGVLSVYLHIP